MSRSCLDSQKASQVALWRACHVVFLWIMLKTKWPCYNGYFHLPTRLHFGVTFSIMLHQSFQSFRIGLLLSSMWFVINAATALRTWHNLGKTRLKIVKMTSWHRNAFRVICEGIRRPQLHSPPRSHSRHHYPFLRESFGNQWNSFKKGQ